MADFAVTIEILSPIHLGSGGANVNIDADIVRDELGLPYFPAKRFKGLLFESAVELEEMFEQSGIGFERALVEDIFHHRSASTAQLIVPNFFSRITRGSLESGSIFNRSTSASFDRTICSRRFRRFGIKRDWRRASPRTARFAISACSMPD